MNIFSYIGNFFELIWEYISHFFETLLFFFDMISNSLQSITSLIYEPLLPPFLSGFIAFVVVISIVKIIFSTGGYHE